MIKVIAFDFGGVITPGIVLPWVKDLAKTDPRYILFQESSHKWDMGELSIDEFYQVLSKITEINEDTLRLSFYSKPPYFPDMIELIRELKKNYKIVIFSNNFSYNLEQYFMNLDFRDLFDEMIVSSDHKMMKPDARFYKKLLKILGVKEKEIVFIDDTQENVDSGNKLGIKSFLFSDSNKLIKELKAIGLRI